MNDETYSWRQFFLSTIVFGLSCWPLDGAIAQTIIPDNTLPDNSAITETGALITIEQGTTAGNNLFHSFQEFSLATNNTALFNNNANIQNIFTRVTGDKISHIDGVIKTNGTANLYLINPKGLIFGENAALDVGGAFIGSTASEINFGDNNYYSAVNPNNPSLLNITAPIGLGFGTQPGNIINRSRNGLAVTPGQTLKLIGGNIDLSGGSLIAEGGSIEISAIINGEQSLINRTTSRQESNNYGDIKLNGNASIEASGAGAGSIEIQGKNLVLREDSEIIAHTLGDRDGVGIQINVDGLKVEDSSLISASTFNSGAGGNINIQASESIEMVGNGFQQVEQILIATFARTLTLPDLNYGVVTGTASSGKAGNITVQTNNLILGSGSVISTPTFGTGKAGNLNIVASELVEISASGVDATNLGNGEPQEIPNQLTITTENLLISEGGFITGATFSNRPGANVQITAKDSIQLGFNPPTNLLPTGIFSNTVFSTGKAGNIEINTRELKAIDGGVISTGSGALVGNTPIPFGGAGGNLSITATERVEITGFALPLGSGLLSSTLSGSPAGNLTVVTGELILTDRGAIRFNSDGSGNSGNILVLADLIKLEDGASITANTVASAGGNIELNAGQIQISNQSKISTDAGNADGGNITINTDTLVALEDSDITANAELGFGGRIEIDAKGIFGTQFRPFITEESDITASSQLGANFSGTVVINNPAVDSTSGLIQLSATVIDPTEQLATGCQVAEENSFTITGLGGLPPDPTERLISKIIWQDLQDFSQEIASRTSPSTQPKPQPSLLQATNWIVNREGNVELIAPSEPEIEPHSSCK